MIRVDEVSGYKKCGLLGSQTIPHWTCGLLALPFDQTGKITTVRSDDEEFQFLLVDGMQITPDHSRFRIEIRRRATFFLAFHDRRLHRIRHTAEHLHQLLHFDVNLPMYRNVQSKLLVSALL